MAKTIFKVSKTPDMAKPNSIIRIDPKLYNELYYIKLRIGLTIGEIANELIRSALSDYEIQFVDDDDKKGNEK